MKIVILDGRAENPGDLSWSGFEELGDLTVYDRTPHDPAEIRRRIGDAEIVITNKTPLSGETIGACPSIRYIGALSTGYNVIDVAAAAAHGITVTSIPAYCTMDVAQMAFALLLEICCHVGLHDDAVHAGEWTHSEDFCFWKAPLLGLEGKTFGVIGYGRIGRATARVAAALGMRTVAYGRHPWKQEEGEAEYLPLEELLRVSDVVSLHCPIGPESEKMINDETIASMKDGAILLNTSRGGLLDEAAVARALRSGKLRAAGVDVLSTEPPAADNPLLSAPNCVITPHIAWASPQGRARLMHTAVENLRAFLAGRPVNTVKL